MLSLGAQFCGSLISNRCYSRDRGTILCVTSSIRSRVSKKKLCSLKDNATAAFVRWNKCLSTQTNASSRSEIPKITAQELMDDSRVFLGKPNLSPQQFSSQSAQLFNKWRHILFTIPHTELEMLDEITRCIDGLVRNVLQKQEMRMSASQSPLVLGLPDNIVDFVCTGIYAWGRVAPHDKFAPIMAEYMYAALLELFEKSEQNRCFQPSEGVYSALAYCWSQTENEDSAPEKALKYLNIIEKDPTMVVQTPTFNSVLRAFARQGRAEEVEQLVESITAENDVHTYEILVQAWMRSNVPDGPNKAYIVLQDGIQNSLRAENEDITPLTELFGRFLNMNNRNPKICDQVLNQMILLQEEHPSVEILQPRHFIITMSAWSSKGEAEKVEQLFRKIRQLYKNGNRNLQPSYQLLCVLLSAFAKNLFYIQQAEGVLKLIETFFFSPSSEPVTNHAYNIMLDAYSRTPGVDKKIKRIRTLMNRMKELSEANNNPSLMPDKVSYASLIKAITEEGRYDSCWEIESIIDMMESSSQPSLQPDSKIYTLALDGFFKSSDITAPSKGESLVDRLRERVVRGVSSAKPDVYMYAILIKLHSNVGDVRKSDSVLSRMIREYKNGNLACRPNETVYITAMGSWKRSKRSDAFDGAFRLFNDMKMQYKEGNLQCKPTLMTFGQLMVILAHSEKPSKQMIGFKLLRSMEEFGLEADRPVLNWYLRVCASVCGGSEERQNSLHSAFEVFESLRSSRMEANSNSFISMVHACANLLDDPKERETQILDVFTKCTEDGYVNRKFLLALQRFLPRERFSEIVPLGPMSRIDMGAIPLLWKLNYVLNEPDK